MLSFEGFVSHAFEPAVTDPEWYYAGEPTLRELDVAADVALAYATRLFAEADVVLARFDDARVNQGLFYLIRSSGLDLGDRLRDQTVPQPVRVDCVHAMSPLFSRLLARRCTDARCHLDEGGARPTNHACYMWWDAIDWPLQADAALDAAALDVMRDTLALPSLACRESALHGLGHFQWVYPAEVAQLIDSYLARPDADPLLTEYAQRARDGRVL